jgi:hypothetical protein
MRLLVISSAPEGSPIDQLVRTRRVREGKKRRQKNSYILTSRDGAGEDTPALVVQSVHVSASSEGLSNGNEVAARSGLMQRNDDAGSSRCSISRLRDVDKTDHFFNSNGSVHFV